MPISDISSTALFDVAPVALQLTDFSAVHTLLAKWRAEGDALIRRAAEAIKKACADAFEPVRTGGDEFSVLLPSKSESAAKEFLDTLKLNIELNNQFYSGPRLSMSAGYAVCQRAGELEAAIRAADQMMYETKRAHYEGGR